MTETLPIGPSLEPHKRYRPQESSAEAPADDTEYGLSGLLHLMLRAATVPPSPRILGTQVPGVCPPQKAACNGHPGHSC